MKSIKLANPILDSQLFCKDQKSLSVISNRKFDMIVVHLFNFKPLNWTWHMTEGNGNGIIFSSWAIRILSYHKASITFPCSCPPSLLRHTSHPIPKSQIKIGPLRRKGDKVKHIDPFFLFINWLLLFLGSIYSKLISQNVFIFIFKIF